MQRSTPRSHRFRHRPLRVRPLTPEKLAILDVAPVVRAGAESSVEPGEILESTLGKLTISFGKSPVLEVVRDGPTLKRRSCRDDDSESAIINYKSAIPDPESVIQAEQLNVPIQIVEPNPDSIIVNAKGVVTSGLNINKRRREDEDHGKKKKNLTSLDVTILNLPSHNNTEWRRFIHLMNEFIIPTTWIINKNYL